MSEVEKLRALLAEAQSAIRRAGNGLDSCFCDDVYDRIDAALAEPVSVCTTCDAMSVSYANMERERDEARAEVERLRGVDCGVTERDGTTTPLCGVCLECAFLRGAEAMREAAARELDRLLTKKKATAIWVAPDEIRALPIPEDDR